MAFEGKLPAGAGCPMNYTVSPEVPRPRYLLASTVTRFAPIRGRTVVTREELDCSASSVVPCCPQHGFYPPIAAATPEN
jgi:hypothetical protein